MNNSGRLVASRTRVNKEILLPQGSMSPIFAYGVLEEDFTKVFKSEFQQEVACGMSDWTCPILGKVNLCFLDLVEYLISILFVGL